MMNPLILKLSAAGGLTAHDHETLDTLCRTSRRVGPRQDLVRQGERPEHVHVVLDGYAYRYKAMPEGRRQILAVLVPGDLCDIHMAVLDAMDHSVATFTACTIVDVGHDALDVLRTQHPRIMRALWWSVLVDEATSRAWLASIGQRTAEKRLASFFCEMLIRLRTVGLAEGNLYDMPFRQTDLADMFGLSIVHVNRMIQELRESELIGLENKRLRVPDEERLRAFCGFDPSYLHRR